MALRDLLLANGLLPSLADKVAPSIDSRNSPSQATGVAPRADISFIMPAYNEEEIVAYTIRRLLGAFANNGHRLELIAVDNGSTDNTGEIIRTIAAEHPSVIYHRVTPNQGYGHGILSGIPLCSGPWIGIIPADGQVDAEDVVRLYESVEASRGPTLAKARRRFRMDGIRRKCVSVAYNLVVRLLWPRLPSIDVNGTPKILPRDAILQMHLESKGWLLDPEIMIKGHYMGLRVLELNVFGRMRGNGLSHVRMGTCWEFLIELVAFRFAARGRRWRRELRSFPQKAPKPMTFVYSNRN